MKRNPTQRCQCCHAPFKPRKPHHVWADGTPVNNMMKVAANRDHCHRTGRKRGWVCNRCNILLGRIESPPTDPRIFAWIRNGGPGPVTDEDIKAKDFLLGFIKGIAKWQVE